MKKGFLIISILTSVVATAQNVGIGTSIPKAGLHVADSSVYFSSPNPLPNSGGISPVQGAGIGLLWISGQAALRVGRETGTNWAYDNVGTYSSSFGLDNSASGVGSLAGGFDNTVIGSYSIALGSYNYARNQRTLAFGNYSRGLGDYSNAIGYDVAAQAYQSTALGRFNKLSGNTVSDVLTDPLLIVGNGTTENNRSNALSILKDGRVLIGSDSLANYQMYVKAGTAPSAIFAESNRNINSSTAIYAKNGSATGNGILSVVTGAGLGTVLAPTFNLNAIAGYGYGSATAVAASSAAGIAIDAKSLSGYSILSDGNIKFDGIGHGFGKLLVSDASGNATWQNPPKITLDNSSLLGQSAIEMRNQGSYVGSFGWTQASNRYFLYDGNTNSNPLLITNGRVGLGNREAATNSLEVNGNASKSSAGSWLANSDARLKTNMAPLTNALDKLLQLKGISYEWNDKQTGNTRPTGTQMGFTAQNIQQVFPNKVSTDAQGFLQTAYGDYDPLVVEAIRELKAENDNLRKAFKAENDELRKALNEIKALLQNK